MIALLMRVLCNVPGENMVSSKVDFSCWPSLRSLFFGVYTAVLFLLKEPFVSELITSGTVSLQEKIDKRRMWAVRSKNGEKDEKRITP